MTSALAGCRDLRVRVSFAGWVGDSGGYCPYRLLFSSGKCRAHLASAREAYETALTYREIRRAASSYIVTHDAACRTGCIAVDNTAMLPPFMPLGRNEDGVFGAMLAFCDPAALFGHIPYGIVHASERPPSYGHAAPLSATETRISELLIGLMRSCEAWPLAPSAIDRLKRLGEFLADLSRLELAAFVAFATRVTLETRQRELRHIDSALSGQSDYPDYWKGGLATYQVALLNSITRPDFFLPIECHGHSSLEDGFRGVQALLGRLGLQLAEWPTVWSTARQLQGGEPVDVSIGERRGS